MVAAPAGAKKTCRHGLANPLTRVERPTDWNTGKGIFSASDPANPFRKNYNIITVPYCTGDVFMGSRIAQYDTLTIAHLGYGNAGKILDEAGKLYPRPKKVVLIGQSAGGLGTIAHIGTLAKRFPDSSQYVINDSGTPFKPPHLDLGSYNAVMDAIPASEIPFHTTQIAYRPSSRLLCCFRHPLKPCIGGWQGLRFRS